MAKITVAKAGTWANPSRTNGFPIADDTIHGELNKHIDRRTVPECSHEWEKDVVLDDGVPYVPLETVNELISENQELREALYYQMTDCQEMAVQRLYTCTGHSTKSILSIIKSIEHLTHNTMTGKDVFNFVYGHMNSKFHIDFKDCPADSSKLQYCWKMGWLPIVSMLVTTLHCTLLHIHNCAPKEMDAMCKAMIKYKQKKSVHPF